MKKPSNFFENLPKILENLPNKTIRLYIILIAAVMFIPFLGNVHLFDWDEINFAEASREMIETGDYLRVSIDYEPFYEKPPLFFWVQTASMKIFGVNEFAARLPNALIGIVALLILFSIGSSLYNKTFGALWVVSYAGSILPYFYFRSGILDPLFNLFMFLSVWYIFKNFNYEENKMRSLLLAGVYSGLAILVKGPVGLLLPGLTFIVFNLIRMKTVKLKNQVDQVEEFKNGKTAAADSTPEKLQTEKTVGEKFQIFRMILFGIVALAVAGLWFGVELAVNGTTFLEAFILYQIRLLTTGDAGFSGPIYYHVVVVLLGCFPASFFLFYSFRKERAINENGAQFRTIMILLLAVVIIIFSIVETKIVHYSSLAYYPVSFLGALALYNIAERKVKSFKGLKISLSVAGVFIGLLLSSIALLGIYKKDIIPYLTDDFVKANLQADSVWYGFEPVIGLLLIVFTIFGVVLLNRNHILKSAFFFYGGTAFTLSLMLPLMLPQIENYTQGAPVAFYESLQGKDVYVKSVGFRSYADIFYSRKMKKNSASGIGVKHSEIENYLIYGNIKKPAYFVTKINEREKWTKIPTLKVLYEKNGFIFLKRKSEKEITSEKND
ncbi:MAG: glycosyltransferase family 39 protein [Ignavibacteriales bacterium]|nr:glycosyltransferase family 39 protein [Ignavibacteriales bacterium]